MRDFQFEGCKVALDMLWDWRWTWKFYMESANVAVRMANECITPH
jgi:hypothetical protein